MMVTLLVEPGDGKIAVVINYRPRGLCAWVDTIGARTVARGPSTHHELLGSSEILVHRVDPVAAGIPSGQAKQPFPEMFRAGLRGVITYRESIHVCLIASQISHAPQGEDVTRGIAILLRSLNGLRSPAGVDGLGEWPADIIGCHAAISAAENLSGSACEAVLHSGVRLSLGHQELLAVETVTEGLVLGVGVRNYVICRSQSPSQPFGEA